MAKQNFLMSLMHCLLKRDLNSRKKLNVLQTMRSCSHFTSIATAELNQAMQVGCQNHKNGLSDIAAFSVLQSKMM